MLLLTLSQLHQGVVSQHLSSNMTPEKIASLCPPTARVLLARGLIQRMQQCRCLVTRPVEPCFHPNASSHFHPFQDPGGDDFCRLHFTDLRITSHDILSANPSSIYASMQSQLQLQVDLSAFRLLRLQHADAP